jgi:hypothetical protein
MGRATYLGYHHVALDVTDQIRSFGRPASSSSLPPFSDAGIGGAPRDEDASRDSTASDSDGGNGGLGPWIRRLNATSVARFGRSIRVALPPRRQLIGRSAYELAFVYDDTGCLVELLNRAADPERRGPVASGWEPWDGKGFVGPAPPSDDERGGSTTGS